MKPFPNILLVAGSGRNVGKTSVVERLIHGFKDHGIIALKVSPHFHALRGDEEFIVRKNEYNIIEENTTGSTKDSSRFLRAGAQKVFFIQALGKNLEEAFNRTFDLLPEHAALIVESGGLRDYIKPGLFIYVKGKQNDNKPADYSSKADVITNLSDFDTNRITWTGKEWKVK
ncbi:MAG: hypothetical protein K9G67_00780 [Bacteroidales bacterium]|nr:hypothetical protein [Bacteroidales bacterium]MCF8343225.1 hypothetical protein [Bacteroidales bacterium]MCF8350872.1 hypothetical protein [Bacteroidales bacterium]MCF8374866.1 hypothetical protein [Bacteroidales bacterium]MCF8399730.1 hypothetical protein [Bacteroidales bacterium]